MRGPRFGGLAWTPLRLLRLNGVLRSLGVRATPWRIHGNWVWLRDEPGSDTLRIVMHEVYKGFYDPLVPLRPGDVVLDLGAHVGGFSIPLALKHPHVRFIAYEPNRRNYDNLVHNVWRSRAQNVEVVHAGVWGHETVIRDRHDAANTGASKSQPWHDVETTDRYVRARRLGGHPVHEVYAGEPVPAKAYPLQDILVRHGVNGNLRLLKMDVEGAEFSALGSADDLVGIDSIIAEIHGDDGNAVRMRELIEAAVPKSRLLVLPHEPYTVQDGQPFVHPNNLGQFPEAKALGVSS